MHADTTDSGITNRFQPPVNVQFSVFLGNRVGTLLQLLEIFQGQHLVLVGLSVNEATDHAVVRLVTSNHVLARRLLQRHQMAFTESDVLAVELTDHYDLVSACTLLLSAEVNVHYVYPLFVQPRRHPVMILHTDEYVLACQILMKRMFNLLGENDLGDNATGSDPLTNPGKN